MVFSLFSKKEPPASKPKQNSTPAQAPSSKPAGTPTASAPAAPGVRNPSVPGKPVASSPPPVVSAASPKRAPDTKSRPAPKESHHRGPDSIINFTPNAKSIEVSDQSAICAALENAALLYANDQTDFAIATLLDGIQNDPSAQSSAQAWMALLDLYQLQNMKKEFDEIALDFVVKFERSPPVWLGTENQTAAPKVAATGVVITKLDATCKTQIEQLIRSADKSKAVRLDLSKVQLVSDEGSTYLMTALQFIKKNKYELTTTGVASLLKILQDLVKSGQKENEPCWQLLLELHLIQGLQQEFDDLAFEYTITFEVSPPSWEVDPYRKPAKPANKAALEPSGLFEEDESAAQDMFVLKGVLAGSSEIQLRELSDYAVDRKQVRIDMHQVQRIDFVCAGTFMNTVTSFVKVGKPVFVVGISQIVLALFQVLGIDKIVKVVAGKAV